VGLWLAHELTATSKMKDCLMSGRSNCNVIEPARCPGHHTRRGVLAVDGGVFAIDVSFGL
jgi:hypothetical protein